MRSSYNQYGECKLSLKGVVTVFAMLYNVCVDFVSGTC